MTQVLFHQPFTEIKQNQLITVAVSGNGAGIRPTIRPVSPIKTPSKPQDINPTDIYEMEYKMEREGISNLALNLQTLCLIINIKTCNSFRHEVEPNSSPLLGLRATTDTITLHDSVGDLYTYSSNFCFKIVFYQNFRIKIQSKIEKK